MAKITNLILLNVPITDYQNQILFNDSKTQYDYFYSKRITEPIDNFNYQRTTGVIAYPKQYDEIYNCNYCMFQNEEFSDKWFYAFVRNMRYINNGRTDLEIEIDVFQTWFLQCNFKRCFVEREHVTDDAIGHNTVPEGLELGEYVVNNVKKYDAMNDMYFIIQTTEWTSGDTKPLATNYGGIYYAGRCIYLR